MPSQFLALRAVRYRLAQSVLLGVLVLAAVAACALGPFYERAVEQAALRSTLATSSVADRGLRIDAPDPGQAANYLPTGRVARAFGPPIQGTEAPVRFEAFRLGSNTILRTSLVTRTDVCAHLTLVSGRCAQGADEITVSAASAKALHLELGTGYRLRGTGGSQAFPLGSLTIVGLYKPFDGADDYWFGRQYSTESGVTHVPNGDAPDILQADAFFVGPAALAALQSAYQASGGGAAPYAGALDVPLAVRRVGVDDIGALRAAVADIRARIASTYAVGDPRRANLATDLPALLDTADKGRAQSRLIIPTLAAQLAIVVLVLVGVVIAVGVEQRRPELALARLRGRSRGNAAQFFVGDVTAIVLLALLPGLVLGWLLCRLMCAALLPDGVTPEWRWPAVAAGVAVAVVTLLVAAVLARGAAAQPIQDLLRSVSPRRGRRSVGLLETGVTIAALAGLVAAFTGGRTNALALITPGLIALLAGLLLSRLLVSVARRAGGRALWRGRLRSALTSLHVARSPNFRRIVTLVCVAVALAVSAVAQWSVAGQARTSRAAVETGAAVVLQVQAPSANALRTATAQADPDGGYALPVIVQTPAGGLTPTMAIGHDGLRDIVQWGDAADRPSRAAQAALSPGGRPDPITVRGDVVQLRLDHVTAQKAAGEPPVRPLSIRLYFRLRTGELTSTTLALRTTASAQTVRASFGGCVNGCQLSRVELVRAAGDFAAAKISIGLTELAVGRAGNLTAAPLGRPEDWANVNADEAAAGRADDIGFVAGDGDGLALEADSHGSSALVQHLDVPVALPCLQAGQFAGDRIGKNGLSVHGLDSALISCVPVGRLPFVPGLGPDGVVIDLDLAIGVSTDALNRSQTYIYLARDDPARERDVRRAMADAGLVLINRHTAVEGQARYDDAPPAWSIQAALVAAGAAIVVAGLLVVVVAYTARRGRQRDLAALRLNGVPAATVRRAVFGEQLSAVLAGVVVGAVVGVIGARIAMPSVPLFVSATWVPRPSPSVPWVPAAVMTGAAVVVLVAAALTAGALIGRRLRPDRLREGTL